MVPSPNSSCAPGDSEIRATLAAIDHGGGVDVDALLAEVVARLRAEGRRVQGLERVPGGACEDCRSTMLLADVSTQETFQVSQDLGPGSKSCRADPAGFARASAVLRRALDDAPDLVVVNRFGSLESEGGGFRAELLDLLAAGVPVLTIVARRHREAWDRFSDGADVLPARRDAVLEWLARVLPPPPGRGTTQAPRSAP